MKNKHTPLLLVILDGWGVHENAKYNAIKAADTPHWDKWWRDSPHTLLDASGTAVGLPHNQMGNSEVGHMHIGAGRLIAQDYTRIKAAIENDEFARNPVIESVIQEAKQNDRAIHILGLLSPGGVHSHEDQIGALCKTLASKHVPRFFVHAFLDGRDTPPRSARRSLQNLQQSLDQESCGEIASIIGRYYAMDRDRRWERTKTAYDLLTTQKHCFFAPDALTALDEAYERGEDDEFVQATSIRTKSPSTIEEGDIVIFMNFRADRARQLSYALTEANFSGFPRDRVYSNCHLVTLTSYAPTLKADIIFPPQSINNTLGEYLSRHHYRQLRIAETEKYAHVTFFFDGGQEHPLPYEDRHLIPSPKLATYDLQPEMSAPQITEVLLKVIYDRQYDVIICNFANADMVGHTGNFAATIKAIECIDHCLGQLAEALQAVGGEMLITADHGNAEKMFDEVTHQAHTAHTNDPVPFIYLGRPATLTSEFLHKQGSLIDLAPTILYLLGLSIPPEMTGKSLLQCSYSDTAPTI
jgi:2,3-bisphosphoglycerate-independent phosphoglycerate mutase